MMPPDEWDRLEALIVRAGKAAIAHYESLPDKRGNWQERSRRAKLCGSMVRAKAAVLAVRRMDQVAGRADTTIGE